MNRRELFKYRWMFPHRFLFIVIALGAIVVLAACQFTERFTEPNDHEEEDEEPPAETRALEVNESVVFEFEPDGAWHPSPYVAYNRHRLRFTAVGEASHLPYRLIEYRIGRLSTMSGPLIQVLAERNQFNVTRSGVIAFRLSPAKAPDYKGGVQVEIARLR